MASILSQNLDSLSTHLRTHGELFSSLAVYPSASFPGRAQEGLLGQLLRKKLEPAVDDHIAEGRARTAQILEGVIDNEERYTRLRALDELWRWAGPAANEQARAHEWHGDYTNEERDGGVENVRTGLRRKLDDGEEESSSEEDSEEGDGDEEYVEKSEVESGEKMEGVTTRLRSASPEAKVNASSLRSNSPDKGNDGEKPVFAMGPPMPVNAHFKYLMTGVLPRG